MRRSRTRSYALMLAGALAGGVLGAAFDQVTVTVSPAYFVLGKGLGVAGAELRLAAAWMGFRGGLSLGALAAGVGLWLEAGGREVQWVRFVATALAAAAICAVASAGLMHVIDPFHVREDSLGALGAREASRYLVAWGAHVGVYMGVILAVVGMAAQARARGSYGVRRGA